jgi:hypothetical protein
MATQEPLLPSAVRPLLPQESAVNTARCEESWSARNSLAVVPTGLSSHRSLHLSKVPRVVCLDKGIERRQEFRNPLYIGIAALLLLEGATRCRRGILADLFVNQSQHLKAGAKLFDGSSMSRQTLSMIIFKSCPTSTNTAPSATRPSAVSRLPFTARVANIRQLVARQVIALSLCLLSFAMGGCKRKYEGVCVSQGERLLDSCWVNFEKKLCTHPGDTFVPQESADKGELYCYLEGFKPQKADEKNPTVLYREKEK